MIKLSILSKMSNPFCTSEQHAVANKKQHLSKRFKNLFQQLTNYKEGLFISSFFLKHVDLGKT